MFCHKPVISRGLAITTVLLVLAAATTARAQTFSVVYNFGTKSTDPANPDNTGTLAQGRDGNLYGTTPSGTVNGGGGVFRLTPAGALTVLHSFSGLSDGGTPYGGLTLGTDGNFYGTTYGGGTAGFGTVFKITPAGTLTTLYSFTDGTDGSEPYAAPVQGTDGNFYGTTSQFTTGLGTIYKITPTGILTPLYQFDNTHGATPFSPLLLGTDGNFYGTTLNGGSNGVVFRITPAGKLAVLHNFDGAHGQGPAAPLVQGNDGNFYGAAAYGGTAGSGVVFKLTPAGGFTVLHTMNGTTDGSATYGLGQAANGNLYGVNISNGTASTGCPSGCGTLFEVEVTPSVVFSLLHNFDGPTGINPASTPVQFTSGLVYGDARFGGTGTLGGCLAQGACGTAFSWSQPGLVSFVQAVTYYGKVGKAIEFLGQGLTGTTAVSFNGTPATSFTVSSGTYLTASVPNGATTGTVMVVTPSGTLTSNHKFRVTPTILSFSPPSGPVGTVVTITGVSLAQTTKLTFGGVAATSFSVNSDTQVTATVPTGAKTGRIVITTPGGTASSTTNFTVTP
jgi:uncharacterized repeat protein (TIGR03803 family)